MKTKKMLAIVLVLAMAISLFAGCTSEDGGNANNANGDNQTEQSPGAEAPSVGETDVGQATLEDAAISVQKDVLNVGIEADVTNWAPLGSGNAGRNATLFSIYQPLVDFNAGEYYPVMLKSYEFSEDGLELYCELWDNIVDSEGNPFTADDALFNFEYAAAGPSPDLNHMLTDVVKTGEYTFTVKMADALEVEELTKIFNWNFVTQEAYEASGDGLSSWPVGTGPYKLVEHTSGYKFVFEKNENYWMREDQITQARDRANVDTINWYVISESAQRTVALEQGEIDMCASVSSKDLDKFDGKNGYKLFSYASNLSMVMFPNCDVSSPCNDVNLRKAVCYAVSSEAILDSVYGGGGSVMYSQAPVWAAGHSDEWANEESYYKYNPDTAKEYLAKSNYNNESLRILCQSNENSTNTAQLIQSFLGQVGITAQVEAYEASVYNDYLKMPDKWDIVVNTRPCVTGSYALTVHSDFSEGLYRGTTYNFIYDDKLQELLTTCMTLETYSAESRDALEQYIKENCYVKGLVNIWTYIVAPDTVSDIVLSVRRTLLPGACIFTE